MNCLLVLSLAVLGASAAPCELSFNAVPQTCGLTLNTVSQGYGLGLNTASQGYGLNLNTVSQGSALQGRNLFAQTPVIENPTSVFPPVVPPTSVSQSCHCLKTVVRPQIRNEIITVPQVDRVVRVVPSPVIEAVTVDLGTNNGNAAFNSGVSGVTGVVSAPRIVEGVTGVVSAPRIVEGVTGVVSAPRIVEGVTGVVSAPRIVEEVTGIVSAPRIVEGVVSGSSFPGFSGVITSGNTGCGCGSNIIV